MENKFKQYRRTQIAEMRPVDKGDISDFNRVGEIRIALDFLYDEYDIEYPNTVSISDADLKNGSPTIGDMIARNPKNHKDQWLVAEQYFKDNFEELTNKEKKL